MNEILKERYKFYLVCYVLGYCYSLFLTGIPTLWYLFPVKMFPLFIGVIGGEICYLAYKKVPAYEVPFKLFKPMLLMVFVQILFKVLYSILLKLGLDLIFFIGIPM